MHGIQFTLESCLFELVSKVCLQETITSLKSEYLSVHTFHWIFIRFSSQSFSLQIGITIYNKFSAAHVKWEGLNIRTVCPLVMILLDFRKFMKEFLKGDNLTFGMISYVLSVLIWGFLVSGFLKGYLKRYSFDKKVQIPNE